MSREQPDLFGEARYPDSPGFVRGVDTSEDAAESMIGDAPHLRALVYAEIWKSTKYAEPGLTCENVEDILEMKHQTASARITELLLGGHIVDTGERRPNRSLRAARVYLPKKCKG